MTTTVKEYQPRYSFPKRRYYRSEATGLTIAKPHHLFPLSRDELAKIKTEIQAKRQLLRPSIKSCPVSKREYDYLGQFIPPLDTLLAQKAIEAKAENVRMSQAQDRSWPRVLTAVMRETLPAELYQKIIDEASARVDSSKGLPSDDPSPSIPTTTAHPRP